MNVYDDFAIATWAIKDNDSEVCAANHLIAISEHLILIT